MRGVVDTSPTVRLLGLAFCRSDPLREVDSSTTCFEEGSFSLLLHQNLMVSWNESETPMLERTGD